MDAGDVDAGPDDADGGDDSDADVPMEIAPTFRNAVATPDAELAAQALAILRTLEIATTMSCPSCYEVSRANVRRLWDQTMVAWETCFADLELLSPEAAQAALACFQVSGSHDRDKLGVFATGVHFDWFGFAFRRALGAAWETRYDTFVSDVQIPSPPETALTQAEFDILTEWFLRGTPWVERALPHGQAVGTCEDFADASVALLAEEGALSGWSARNEAAGMLMHDCPGSDPLACLISYADAATTTYGAAWSTVPSSVTRVLYEVPYNTSYWTRASPDGRFVAHGGGASTGASVVDLTRSVSIGVSNALYDPGFFPDGSGFMFQGGGTRVCRTAVLTAGNPVLLTLTEPGCSGASDFELQQHLGASLDGGDYWVVNSPWRGDLGSGNTDPPVRESAAAHLTLHRVLNTGAAFLSTGSYDEAIPYESMAVVSPTMRTLVTQIGDASGRPIGFVLRRLEITRSGDGTPTSIELPVIGHYCYPSGVANLSFDDRFIVTHHRATPEDARDLGFLGPGDPDFVPYNGISNIYVIDLVTGERTRISHMMPGQRALFPSFRSDGWIYYVVRDGLLPEYIVASDAAIRLR